MGVRTRAFNSGMRQGGNGYQRGRDGEDGGFDRPNRRYDNNGNDGGYNDSNAADNLKRKYLPDNMRPV
jgi:hypothetical protein